MAHKIQSVIVLDVETGGLSHLKTPITQVAMTSFSLYDGKEISRYDAYVKNYANLAYEQAALNITGITLAKLAQDGKQIQQVVKELCEHLLLANPHGATKKPILCGQNIAFDIGFLTYAFNHCKVDISKYLECKQDGHGNYYPVSFDTMWMARLKWGGDETMTKYNLAAICQKAGVELTDAHGAPQDVAATKEVFMKFMHMLRSSDGSGVLDEEKKTRLRNTFAI